MQKDAPGNDAPIEKACRVSAFLDGQGGFTPFTPDAATLRQPPDNKIYWVHVAAGHREARHLLSNVLELPRHIVEALTAVEVRPRFEEIAEDSALIILRGITNIPGPTPDDLASIRFIITPRGIVSAGRRKSQAMGELKKRFEEGRGARNLSEMLPLLLNVLNDALEPVLQDLEDKIEEYEDMVLKNMNAIPRQRLAELRKEITQYRRHLSPQRDVLSRLMHVKRSWLPREAQWQVQEAFDRTTRFIEDLDTLRERAEIVADDLLTAQNGKLNKNLYLLSLITVIFMPLTFLTGLLGMNVNGIPGAHQTDAFAVIVGICFGLMAMQVLLFRLYRWL